MALEIVCKDYMAHGAIRTVEVVVDYAAGVTCCVRTDASVCNVFLTKLRILLAATSDPCEDGVRVVRGSD